jgi:hypothetical protein
MRSLRSIVLAALSPLLLPSSIGQQSKEPPAPDFAHDLGVRVRDVKPLAVPIPAAARKKVAEHVGRDPAELAGIRLFTGTITSRGSPERVEDLVVVPLAGAAKGGRLVFSAAGGTAREMGLWGALDFDGDPTLRWRVFIEQLRVAGTQETGSVVGPVSLAMEPAREVGARVERQAKGTDDGSRLASALLRQRQVMRRNGIWLGMMRRGKERPQPAWIAELAAEMEQLAKLSPVLEPVLGPGSAIEHARFARDMAAVYSDMAAVLEDDPQADLRELQESLRPSCMGCHGNGKTVGEWPERAAKRRAELGLADTRLQISFDVAPTLGDHDGVSKELADKVRAGLLLLEAARH